MHDIYVYKMLVYVCHLSHQNSGECPVIRSWNYYTCTNVQEWPCSIESTTGKCMGESAITNSGRQRYINIPEICCVITCLCPHLVSYIYYMYIHQPILVHACLYQNLLSQLELQYKQTSFHFSIRCISCNSTVVVFLAHQYVPIITPVGWPRILHKNIINTIQRSVTHSQDLMIQIIWSTTWKQNDRIA